MYNKKFNLKNNNKNIKNINIVTHNNKNKTNNDDLKNMIPVIEKNPPSIISKFKPRIYKIEEIDNLLKDYYILDKNLWGSLKKGDHMRYKTKEGKFRIGGYVTYTFNNKKKNTFMAKLICKINNTPNKLTNPSWCIDFNKIEIIWKKQKIYNQSEFDKLIKIVHQHSLKITRLENIIKKIYLKQ